MKYTAYLKEINIPTECGYRDYIWVYNEDGEVCDVLAVVPSEYPEPYDNALIRFGYDPSILKEMWNDNPLIRSGYDPQIMIVDGYFR